jgi:hypothetical protein
MELNINYRYWFDHKSGYNICTGCCDVNGKEYCIDIMYPRNLRVYDVRSRIEHEFKRYFRLENK